jgi:hypothetical protein
MAVAARGRETGKDEGGPGPGEVYFTPEEIAEQNRLLSEDDFERVDVASDGQLVDHRSHRGR